MIYFEYAKHYLKILRLIKKYEVLYYTDPDGARDMLEIIRNQFGTDEIVWEDLDGILHFCKTKNARIDWLKRECTEEFIFFHNGYRHWLSNGKYKI
jgi:hypothetical protein